MINSLIYFLFFQCVINFVLFKLFFAVAVVIAFFICWAPFHAQRLMAVYIMDPTESDIVAFSYLTNISGVLYYVSATINPILYSIMSLKFRHAFRDTLGRCLGRGNSRRGRGRHMSLYNSTLRSAGYDVTDLTVVSEVGHQETTTTNGSKKPFKNLDFKEVVISSVPLSRKKTSCTISNASLRVTDAFEDSGISEYIDDVKDSKC